MESSMLHCVNPYDVNPISGVATIPQQEEESFQFVKNVKLEMEEFSDLAPFLPENMLKATSSSIDELNTPIFDKKGPFDFMVHENTSIQPAVAEDPFKFEYDTIRSGNSVISSKQLNDFSVYSNNMSVQLQEDNNSELVNIVQGSEANLQFIPSESDQGNIYIINNENETPIHVLQSEDQISASLFKIEDNSVVSVNDIQQYSNASSPSNDYIINSDIHGTESQYTNVSSPDDKKLGIVTPEDSNSCPIIENPRKIPKLNLSQAFFNHQMVLNTPDVIDTVVDLEFNIINYINEKDIATVNIEDIHFENPTTSRGLNIGEIQNNLSLKLRKRKAPRRYEDDDEDYVPPSKKSSKKVSVEESDSDSEDDVSIRNPKRGRPPRRTSSISSDHSDASKYRELRDKNNEASRKSRLKRKMKEVTLEAEADLLDEKNIKLKAQVEELEKMVNNFRHNLFKIMLKK